jgi:hypothetical protein
VWLDLFEGGWRVSVNTIVVIMAEHRWYGRQPRKRQSLTKAGKRPVAPDLLGRAFLAARPDERWCGDVERHEALLNRAVVKGHRLRLVAASRKKLRAARSLG